MPSMSGYPERKSRFEQFESRHLLSVNPLAPETLASSVSDTSAIVPLVSPDLLDVDYTTSSDPIGIDYVRANYDLSGLGQTVVIIDTGLAYNHPAFTNNDGTSRVVAGYDFAENDNDPYDEGYHGTHVTGILAADDPNVMGLAPEVDLVVLRVFDDNGNSEFTWVEDALQWVVDHQYDFANPITTVNVSLGAILTEQTADDCSSLEDELAAIEGAGIFTAVAAGNKFMTIQDVGLSFPASSEYVVPVASVDGNGGMSFFSQRDTQVIAAPGRSIVSTVPDKFGDHDGLDDDYGRFSGTSMATPYVSGAAVLLREALADVGVTEVNQDLLYDLMYATGDFVYDQITGQSYCSLNLARAVATVYTSYAGNQTDPPGTDDPGTGDPGTEDPGTSDPGTSDPDPGEPVDNDPPATDWGAISDATFSDVAITSGSAKFNFTAARDGLMSVMLGATTANVRLLDAGGNEVASLAASGRADFAVLAGEQYTLEVTAGLDTASSETETLEARLVNLVSVSGSSVSVFGTDAEDQFAVTVGDTQIEVQINGVEYTFDAAAIHQVAFDGGAGQDQAVLTGGVGNDSAEVHVDRASVVGSGYTLSTAGTEVHHLFGGGGVDTVVMYDSAGDDQFIAAVGDVTLAGEGFSTRATDFTNAMARSTAGGNDSALFLDSPSNDTFVVTMDYAKMTGAGFYHRAEGFLDVKAISSAGGKDTAYLRDSAGNDTLTTTIDLVTLLGAGFRFQVEDFRYAMAYSQEGGSDKAVVYDSAGDDSVLATPAYVKLSGAGFYQRFSGFGVVEVHATAGGNDTARFYDSAGDDVFEASARGARLTGDGFRNTLYGFDSINAIASAGGNDTAILRGGVGDDLLYFNGVDMELFGDSYRYRASQFDYFYAETGGGNDKAVLLANSAAGSESDSSTSKPGVRLTSMLESLRMENEAIAADLYGLEHIQAYTTKTATHESKADATDYLLELFGTWEEK